MFASTTRGSKERAVSVDHGTSSLATPTNSAGSPRLLAGAEGAKKKHLKEKKSKEKKKQTKKEKKSATVQAWPPGGTTGSSQELPVPAVTTAPMTLCDFSTENVPRVMHHEIPSQLDKFLVTEGLEVVDGIINRLRIEDMSDVCNDLFIIFEVHGQNLRLTKWAVRKELSTSSSEETLFRQAGVGTCMVSTECKRKGNDYLAGLFRPFVQKICSETKSMEVDPQRLRPSASAEELEANTKRLVEASQDALDIIFASANSFPQPLKRTFLVAHNEITQKMPRMKWISIANFYFLRFVAPALVSPKASGLYQGNPSPQALRALMLISKTLSNAANGVTFGDKENYMSIMNSVITENQPRMREFLEKLISASDEMLDPITAASFFPHQSDIYMARCRLLALIYSYRNAILPLLMNIPSPLPGWTLPTRMGSGSNKSTMPDEQRSSLKTSSGRNADADQGSNESKTGEPTLGQMLTQLLDAYRVYCPDWVSDEDKEIKKRVQDELLERFEGGLARTMRPVTAVALPSNRILRLLLEVEKQRTKELEEELRIIKLKLNAETQSKRDLQLQILRGNNAPALSVASTGWARDRQKVASQFTQMYDMLNNFRVRMTELEKTVLNEAATEGGLMSLRTAENSEVPPVSPRAKSGKGAKRSNPKRLSWNLKLNPLINNT